MDKRLQNPVKNCYSDAYQYEVVGCNKTVEAMRVKHVLPPDGRS
jgi:hypothetical protein